MTDKKYYQLLEIVLKDACKKMANNFEGIGELNEVCVETSKRVMAFKNLEKANQKLIEWIVLSVLYHESDFSLHFKNTALYELKESGKKLIKHNMRLGNE